MPLPATTRAILLSLLLFPLQATAEPPAAAEPLDFTRHVMPLLDRFGCNTAACHGATAGQGGLKLSLFGADVKGDYDALTRPGKDRRIDCDQPAESLLLLKATQTIPHQGGKRLEPGSPECDQLTAWIARGAVLAVPQAPTWAVLEISVSKRTLSPGEALPLGVTGVLSDGSRRDLTAEAFYRSSDATVVRVDKGTIRAEGCGQATILASYRRKAAVVQILVPQTLAEPFPALEADNKIDELVYAKLKELGIPPSERASDAVFLRRVSLDVTGTLPTVAETRAFLADPDPEKRQKLVDRLLASEEFADYWAMKWSDLFRIKSEYPSNLWPNAVQAYHHWIRDAIATNKPYDQFARELLTATGSNFRVPEANFYRAFLKRDPQTIGEVTALVFMGARLGCARCHGHPTEDWSLDDDLGMAAFFAPLRYKNTREWKEEIVYLDPQSVFRRPQTSETIVPRLPGGPVVEVRPGEDPREKFAAWLTAPENPWFAKNIVNRIWFWLLGRGIVHEPDDLRSTNPPENPELLDYLAQELVAQKYDLKHVYRLILNSRTYQRSARTSATNVHDVAHFSHYYVKRLGAEMLLDAIGQVTQRWDTYRSIIPEPFVVLPEGFRATHLADGSMSLPFLELFGRPPRDTAYESDRDLTLSLRQTLHLLNSSDVQNKINTSPRLKRLAKEVPDDAQAIEEIYLATLCRLPTDEERAKIADYRSGKGKNVPEALRTAKKETAAALATVTEELKKATAETKTAEQAAKEAEADVDKRKAADEAKARCEHLTNDQKAADAAATAARKKLDEAKAAIQPGREQAFQDLLWALFNSKEFLFNH